MELQDIVKKGWRTRGAIETAIVSLYANNHLATASAATDELAHMTAELAEVNAAWAAAIKRAVELQKETAQLRFVIDEIKGEIGWDDELTEQLAADGVADETYMMQWIKARK